MAGGGVPRRAARRRTLTGGDGEEQEGEGGLQADGEDGDAEEEPRLLLPGCCLPAPPTLRRATFEKAATEARVVARAGAVRLPERLRQGSAVALGELFCVDGRCLTSLF